MLEWKRLHNRLAHTHLQHHGRAQAATERALSQSTTVIVDAPNYIKGYRYELYVTLLTLSLAV